MAFEFSPEQRAAVSSRGCNLLVSAAAGSGKTRVLVGRVISRILEERLDITDFLIITFTRAAAAELRDRFQSEFSELAANDPSNRHLLRQLGLVSSAKITTIDSFNNSLIREFSHLTGLAANFRVCEGAELDLLRAEALSLTLERIYKEAESDTELSAFLASASAGRFDTKIENSVSTLYAAMMSHPFPELWAKSTAAAYENPKAFDELFGKTILDLALDIALQGLKTLKTAANLLADEPELAAKYLPVILADCDYSSAMISALNHGWNDALSSIVRPVSKLASAPRGYPNEVLKERIKSLRQSWKDGIESIAAMICDKREVHIAEMREQAPAISGLLRAVFIFYDEFKRLKNARAVVDFNDLGHETVRLLCYVSDDGEVTPSDTADEVGARFAEVLVDEFQDTNGIQTLIADMLTSGRKNLFVVGDVKQSIYRFRLAKPEIFLERYNRYPLLHDAVDGASKVNLSMNFRSRAEVIDSVNYIFERLMTGGFSQIEYGEAERLTAGRIEPPDPKYTTEFFIVDSTGGDNDEQSVSATAYEAAFVAEKIQNMLASSDFRPDDIAILLRSAANRAWMFETALADRGIPCSNSGAKTLTAELHIMLSLLKTIENPYQDIPLVAVLRSPVYGWSSDMLASVRSQMKNTSFYEAVLFGAESGDEFCVQFLESLSSLRSSAEILPTDKLITHIYAETGIVGIYGAMRGGHERRENLLRIFALAQKFATENAAGLYGFTEYISKSLENGSFFPEVTGSIGVVRIMTIHKSKGLEFPVVFLCGLSSRFNLDDTRGDLVIHPELGIGLKYFDKERGVIYPTAAWSAVSTKLRDESVAEELRVLYVAMTRAREKLIMTCTMPDSRKKLEKMLSGSVSGADTVRRASSPTRFLIPLFAAHPDGKILRELSGDGNFDANACGNFRVGIADMVFSPEDGSLLISETQNSEPSPETEIPDINALLDWNYSHPSLAQTPSKLTATQLKGRATDAELEDDAPAIRTATPRRPQFMGKTALTAAERGTALHLAMQFIDFGRTVLPQGVEMEIERLKIGRYLTPEQADAVDCDKIAQFFTSPLGLRILRGENLRREFKFSILDDASRYFADIPENSEEVLLQGMCDLFFEENSEIIVVDFKTDSVSSATVRARAEDYRPQLEAYGHALERICKKKVSEKILYFFATGDTISV